MHDRRICLFILLQTHSEEDLAFFMRGFPVVKQKRRIKMKLNTFKNNTFYANPSYNRGLFHTYIGILDPTTLHAYTEKTKAYICKGKSEKEAEREFLKYQRILSKKVVADIAHSVVTGNTINNSLHILISRKDGTPVEINKVSFSGVEVYQIELPDADTPEADEYLVFVFDGHHRFEGSYQAWLESNKKDHYEVTAVYYVDMKMEQVGKEFKRLNCGRKVSQMTKEYIDHYNEDPDLLMPEQKQNHDIFEALIKMSSDSASPLFNRLNYGQEIPRGNKAFRMKYFTDAMQGLSPKVAANFSEMFNAFFYAVQSVADVQLGSATLSQAYKIAYLSRLFNKIAPAVSNNDSVEEYRASFENVLRKINVLISENALPNECVADRKSLISFTCRGTTDGFSAAGKDFETLQKMGIIDCERGTVSC